MGLIIFFLYVWFILKKYYYSDPITARSSFSILQSTAVLLPILPSDPGFWSLKWSAIRHGIIFLVFASLVYWVNTPVLNTISTYLNLLYTLFEVWWQHRRCSAIHRFIASGSSESDYSFLRSIIRICTAVAVYAVYLQILLYVVYAVRL